MGDTGEIYLDDLIKTNRVVYDNLLRICTLLDLIRSNKYYNSEEYQAIKKQQGGTGAEKVDQIYSLSPIRDISPIRDKLRADGMSEDSPEGETPTSGIDSLTEDSVTEDSVKSNSSQVQNEEEIDQQQQQQSALLLSPEIGLRNRKETLAASAAKHVKRTNQARTKEYPKWESIGRGSPRPFIAAEALSYATNNEGAKKQLMNNERKEFLEDFKQFFEEKHGLSSEEENTTEGELNAGMSEVLGILEPMQDQLNRQEQGLARLENGQKEIGQDVKKGLGNQEEILKITKAVVPTLTKEIASCQENVINEIKELRADLDKDCYQKEIDKFLKKMTKAHEMYAFKKKRWEHEKNLRATTSSTYKYIQSEHDAKFMESEGEQKPRIRSETAPASWYEKPVPSASEDDDAPPPPMDFTGYFKSMTPRTRWAEKMKKVDKFRLQEMGVDDLQRRAVDGAVDSDIISRAMGSENPKEQLIKLIVQAQEQQQAQEQFEPETPGAQKKKIEGGSNSTSEGVNDREPDAEREEEPGAEREEEREEVAKMRVEINQLKQAYEEAKEKFSQLHRGSALSDDTTPDTEQEKRKTAQSELFDTEKRYNEALQKYGQQLLAEKNRLIPHIAPYDWSNEPLQGKPGGKTNVRPMSHSYVSFKDAAKLRSQGPSIGSGANLEFYDTPSGPLLGRPSKSGKVRVENLKLWNKERDPFINWLKLEYDNLKDITKRHKINLDDKIGNYDRFPCPNCMVIDQEEKKGKKSQAFKDLVAKEEGALFQYLNFSRLWGAVPKDNMLHTSECNVCGGSRYLPTEYVRAIIDLYNNEVEGRAIDDDKIMKVWNQLKPHDIEERQYSSKPGGTPGGPTLWGKMVIWIKCKWRLVAFFVRSIIIILKGFINAFKLVFTTLPNLGYNISRAVFGEGWVGGVLSWLAWAGLVFGQLFLIDLTGQYFNLEPEWTLHLILKIFEYLSEIGWKCWAFIQGLWDKSKVGSYAANLSEIIWKYGILPMLEFIKYWAGGFLCKVLPVIRDVVWWISPSGVKEIDKLMGLLECSADTGGKTRYTKKNKKKTSRKGKKKKKQKPKTIKKKSKLPCVNIKGCQKSINTLKRTLNKLKKDKKKKKRTSRK